MKKLALIVASISLIIALLFVSDLAYRSEFIQRRFGSVEKKEFYRKADLLSQLVSQDIEAHKKSYGHLPSGFIKERYEVRSQEVGIDSGSRGLATDRSNQ